MTKQSFYPFRSERAKAEYEAFCLDRAKAWQGFCVPCLFLVGENEKIYSARAAVQRLIRIAPQVKAGIIPGAGHDLTMVQADLVIRMALAFLGERAGAAAAAA